MSNPLLTLINEDNKKNNKWRQEEESFYVSALIFIVLEDDIDLLQADIYILVWHIFLKGTQRQRWCNDHRARLVWFESHYGQTKDS